MKEMINHGESSVFYVLMQRTTKKRQLSSNGRTQLEKNSIINFHLKVKMMFVSAAGLGCNSTKISLSLSWNAVKRSEVKCKAGQRTQG